jgi:hypothetical protein
VHQDCRIVNPYHLGLTGVRQGLWHSRK